MPWSPAKSTIVVILVLALLGVGTFAFLNWQFGYKVPSPATPTPPVDLSLVNRPKYKYKIIGTSVEGRKLETYTYGTGTTILVFVGGVHGGYEWNSVLLANQFIDYLSKNPKTVPSNLSVTVIPNLNPDAVFAVTGKEGRFTMADVSTDQAVLTAARFNANKVDLNRNFDCKWQATSTWQKKKVSGGTVAFSEPETAAFRDFVLAIKPAGVVFWHSKSNAVYASQCEKGILPATLEMMKTYATAADYPAVKTFDAYATTGAADDWLASQKIPAITVELSTHETIEWDKNLAGIKALLGYYGQNLYMGTAKRETNQWRKNKILDSCSFFANMVHV